MTSRREQIQPLHSLVEKRVAGRVQIVLCNPLLLSIHGKFGGEVFRRSSIFHGLECFLKENNISGKCCFEIGTWNGLTAIVLSKFFKRVVTVDIAHNKIKREIIAHAGVKNIECIDIRDNAEKEKIAKSTDFDFAYLDGDHAADTQSDWNLTAHCGRVLFHEFWKFQPPVWDLVNALPRRNVTFGGECFALWEK